MRQKERSNKPSLWWEIRETAYEAVEQDDSPYQAVRGAIMSSVYYAVLYDMSSQEGLLMQHMREYDETER